MDLIAIFSTSNENDIILAKLILEREQIPFFAQGNYSRLGTTIAVPVRFMVHGSLAEKAKKVLQDLIK